MKIVKVDATTSTNRLSRLLNKENNKKDFCVSAEFQTEGRGQLNSSWQSKKSENLMFTIVFNRLQLDVKKQFLLNALICLKIYKVLQTYNLPKLSLKWPNDILSGNSKICGILIENSLSGNLIKTAFIGIGLNVNQTEFEDLPNATSLKKILEHSLNRNRLLENLVKDIETIPEKLKIENFDEIIKSYKKYLYKFNIDSQFVLPNGEVHSGLIKDIALDGQLLVKFKSGKEKYYHYKEIRQKY